MTAARQHKYHTLDALRGVAAIAVMIGHFKPFGSPGANASSSYLAVDLFFVLSGFVLAHSYMPKLEAGLSTPRFMWLRFVRMWPLIALGIGLSVLCLLAFPVPRDKIDTIADVARATSLNLVFLPDAWNPKGFLFPVNAPEWSLFFEFVANFLFAAGLYRLRGPAEAAVLGIFAIGVLAACAHFHGMNVGWSRTNAWAGLCRVGYSFFLGVAIYRYRDLWQPRVPAIAPWVVVAMAALLLWMSVNRWERTVYDAVFIIVLSPLIVILAAKAEPVIGLKWAIWLGLLSYPLYALHRPAWQIIDYVSTPATRPLVSLILGIVVILISGFPAQYYDKAVRRWLGGA